MTRPVLAAYIVALLTIGAVLIWCVGPWLARAAANLTDRAAASWIAHRLDSTTRRSFDGFRQAFQVKQP